LAEHLAKNNAVIFKIPSAGAYPAYAQGDRRKRPLRWVSRESFQNLTSFGGLQSAENGFRVSDSFARRLKSGDSHARQHRRLEEREIYIEAGVRRTASVNASLTAFDRLCRLADPHGVALLSKAEQEAGCRLIGDYERAGHGHISTQNYMSAGADKTGYAGGAEDGHIARIDAGTRFTAAKAAMGEGLDKAVLAVCCHDQHLEQIERAEKWAAGSGLTLLKMGLTRLVKHYGSAAGRG